MTSLVTRKDRNWTSKLATNLRKMNREVAVGFPKGVKGIAEVNPTYAKDGHDVSVLEVAIWNNFGTKEVPRRPFMEQSKPKLEKAFKKIMLKNKPSAQEPKKLDKILKIAALQAEAIVRNEITNGGFVPNAPGTVLRKGSSRPLIDSGDMRKYVASVIRTPKK